MLLEDVVESEKPGESEKPIASEELVSLEKLVAPEPDESGRNGSSLKPDADAKSPPAEPRSKLAFDAGSDDESAAERENGESDEPGSNGVGPVGGTKTADSSGNGTTGRFSPGDACLVSFSMSPSSQLTFGILSKSVDSWLTPRYAPALEAVCQSGDFSFVGCIAGKLSSGNGARPAFCCGVGSLSPITVKMFFCGAVDGRCGCSG